MNLDLKRTERSRFERHPIITSLGVAIVALVAIDFGLGAIFNETRPKTLDPNFHHGLLPMLGGTHQKWGNLEGSLRTNSLGFVDRETRQVPLVWSGRRILFMGDSFLQGEGIDYEKNAVGRIQIALANRQIDVLNAAVVSYSPKLHYLKARYFIEVVGLRVDEIVVYIDASDAQDEIVYKDFKPSALDPATLARRAYAFALQKSFAAPRLEFATYAIVMAYRRTMNLISIRRNPQAQVQAEMRQDSLDRLAERHNWTLDEVAYKAWAKSGLALGAENLDQLVDLCRRHGISLSLGIYPTPSDIHGHDSRNHHRDFWRGFAAARGIRLHDHFDDFVPREGLSAAEIVENAFIVGDVHWNETGHRMIAEFWLRERSDLMNAN